MRARLLLSVALLAMAPGAASAQTAWPGAAAIGRDDLMRTVEYLSAPERRGRLSGGPGYHAAAREMARRFERAGLAPGGDRGWFQRLEVEYAEIERCEMAIVGADGGARPLTLGVDHTCRGLTGSGKVEAGTVFAGYGISRPDLGYDDYAGLDVRGKVVLVFKEPPPFTTDSAGWGTSASMRAKGLAAAAHGAAALLVVPSLRQERPQEPIGSMLEGEERQDERFPRLQVSVETARALASPGGPDLAALQAAIDSTRAPRSQPLPGRVRLRVRARYRAAQPTVNVVGVLPGSDRAGSCVVIGAHLDHVGTQGSIYFPGANDNASGSAAVVAMAEAMARSGARPRRTVVFALFASEESGLHGSRRFVERPPVPRDSIVAYLNLDCVGHGDSVEVGGGKDFPELWRTVQELDANTGRLLVAASGGGGGADAAPFFRAGIPTLYFASRPSYTHLHRPTDTPETLNPALLEHIARLAGRTAWTLTTAPEAPPRRAAGEAQP